MKAGLWVRGTSMVGLAALALGAVAGQDAISLMRKPKVGAVAEYAVSAEFEGIKFSSKEIEKVTDVKPDGTFSVQTDSKDTEVDLGGQTMNPPDSSEVSEFSPTGRVISIASDTPATPEAYRIVHLQSFETPVNSVKVGDEIKYAVPADTKLGTPAVSADYKVVGLEKVQDWDTVKLTFKTMETEGDTKSSMSGTAWYATSDGGLVKSAGEWDNVQYPGAPAPLTGKYNMVRTK